MEDPHAALLEHPPLLPHWLQDDLVVGALELKGIAGGHVQLVPHFFGDNHAPRLVDGKLGRHNGKCKWHFPQVNGIFHLRLSTSNQREMEFREEPVAFPNSGVWERGGMLLSITPAAEIHDREPASSAAAERS